MLASCWAWYTKVPAQTKHALGHQPCHWRPRSGTLRLCSATSYAGSIHWVDGRLQATAGCSSVWCPVWRSLADAKGGVTMEALHEISNMETVGQIRATVKYM